jgi:hypothetical protein
MRVELLQSRANVNLTRDWCGTGAWAGRLKTRRLPMVVEPERVTCEPKSVVRRSNRPEDTPQLIQVTFNPSKNLIHSRKRIITYAGIGHCRRLSMHMKALRLESRK